MRTAISILVFLLCMPSALAQRIKDNATYFCTEEIAGGLSVDETTRKWCGTKFRAEDKFVLKFKFVRTRTLKLLGKDEPVDDFKVTITKAGSNDAQECWDFRPNASDTDTVYVFRTGYVICNASFTEHRFNPETNRFLSIYLVGYLDGENSKKNTPAITGGTCTKIN